MLTRSCRGRRWRRSRRADPGFDFWSKRTQRCDRASGIGSSRSSIRGPVSSTRILHSKGWASESSPRDLAIPAGGPRRICGAHAAHLRVQRLRYSLTNFLNARAALLAASPESEPPGSPDISPRSPAVIAGPPITETELPLKLFARGKVRDTYELPGDRLLMVATDRIPAFDHVLPN